MALMVHPIEEVVRVCLFALAADPELVRITEARRSGNYLRLEITPGSNDNTGAIIGRGGESIQAVRALVDILGARYGLTVTIRVLTTERQAVAGGSPS